MTDITWSRVKRFVYYTFTPCYNIYNTQQQYFYTNSQESLYYNFFYLTSYSAFRFFRKDLSIMRRPSNTHIRECNALIIIGLQWLHISSLYYVMTVTLLLRCANSAEYVLEIARWKPKNVYKTRTRDGDRDSNIIIAQSKCHSNAKSSNNKSREGGGELNPVGDFDFLRNGLLLYFDKLNYNIVEIKLFINWRIG